MRAKGPRGPGEPSEAGVSENDSREDRINRVREVTEEVTWLSPVENSSLSSYVSFSRLCDVPFVVPARVLAALNLLPKQPASARKRRKRRSRKEGLRTIKVKEP